jgi:hypothetical protein
VDDAAIVDGDDTAVLDKGNSDDLDEGKGDDTADCVELDSNSTNDEVYNKVDILFCIFNAIFANSRDTGALNPNDDI